jgi:hypothetical protein
MAVQKIPEFGILSCWDIQTMCVRIMTGSGFKILTNIK